jgi:hypothetical protein
VLASDYDSSEEVDAPTVLAVRVKYPSKKNKENKSVKMLSCKNFNR